LDRLKNLESVDVTCAVAFLSHNFPLVAKLIADGILRGTGMMGRFMTSTFTDLILRVVLAIVLSRVIGSATGIWLAWPIGWTIATVMSLLFCVNGIKKLKREKTGRIE
jgi:Na+-driven multidrug efflux pump